MGRTQEINAILHDIEMIQEGGASFRFIVGKYGSGKSFLLQTIRNYAAARGFAVVDGDLSPERRFAGTKGQGLATYKELIQNLSTKAKPDGGALPLLQQSSVPGSHQEHRKELQKIIPGLVVDNEIDPQIPTGLLPGRILPPEPPEHIALQGGVVLPGQQLREDPHHVQ